MAKQETTFLGYDRWSQVARAYLIIVGMGVVSFIIRLAKFDEFTLSFQFRLFLISLVVAAVLWESMRLVHRWLERVYPFERNLSARIVIQLVIGAAIGLCVRIIIYFFGEPYVPFRLDSLFLATTWAIYIMIPVGLNLGFFTVYFINRWKDTIVQAERLEREKSQVQFDNLKNQLNPHFLFNALASLNTLIFDNQKLASEFVQQLSKVYRYVLQNKNKNFVPLATELDFIAHYVKLLETRFDGALKIQFDVKPAAVEKAIVPVTLQILIENAIKHNVVDKGRTLVIEVIDVGDYLVVSNNLQVKRTVETSNKQGLDNLRSLYRFLTDRPVVVEQTEERFFVKVPLL